MQPLIITVAGVGAELTLEQQPNLPATPDELARDAAACRDAGASIYHLHVRDPQGRPTMDVATFESASAAIRSASDLIVQFTTGGSVGDGEEERLAPLELRPEMATLTTGTVNFGAGVFWNPPGLIERLHRRMRELGILPEFEIFEAGMIANATALTEPSDRAHFDLVLGVPGAMPAWDDSVRFLSSHLPDGATWSATGIGRAHTVVAEAAISLGGHVRTGFEDVRYLGPGLPARSNSELVARVTEIAARQGREVATPDMARGLLGLG
jgi:3-keto-5-aminohexanoate cleavage enzyme